VVSQAGSPGVSPDAMQFGLPGVLLASPRRQQGGKLTAGVSVPKPPGALDAAVPLLPPDPLGPEALPVVATPPAVVPILFSSI
jgi:hypothetical protein